MTVPSVQVWRATFQREWFSLRYNRFLYWHIALLVALGLLALVSPPEAAARGAAWWIQQVVVFAVSLSSLLLGYSSSHAEAEEWPLLLTHPLPIGSWICGKALALVTVTFPSAFLLVLPTLMTGHADALLGYVGSAAGGLSVLFALLGLALGLWVRDPVRGLICSIALWLVLLVGTDLLLVMLAGNPWIQRNSAWWVAPLMINPLDAFRVTVLFSVEKTAFSGINESGLTRWWIAHAGLWLGVCLLLWSAAALSLTLRGMQRRPDA
jgi:hypothetical protein